MHESGRYLFPGTGGVDERGRNGGVGYSVNVPARALHGRRVLDLLLRGRRPRGPSRLRSRPDPLPERLRRPRPRPPDAPLRDDPPLRARPAAHPRPRPRALRGPLGRHRRRGLRHLARRPARLDRALGRRLPPGDAREGTGRLALEVGREEPRGAARASCATTPRIIRTGPRAAKIAERNQRTVERVHRESVAQDPVEQQGAHPASSRYFAR